MKWRRVHIYDPRLLRLPWQLHQTLEASCNSALDGRKCFNASKDADYSSFMAACRHIQSRLVLAAINGAGASRGFDLLGLANLASDCFKFGLSYCSQWPAAYCNS